MVALYHQLHHQAILNVYFNKFHLDTLTNVKLQHNGTVLLTTSNQDGSHRVTNILKVCVPKPDKLTLF